MMELLTGLIIGLFVGAAIGFLLASTIKTGGDDASN